VQRGLAAPARRAPADAAAVERGKALFQSDAVGCSGCHVLEQGTSDRRVHDIGSRSKHDDSGSFRTQPLLFVGDTAPYFHDGRYATLEALVDDKPRSHGLDEPALGARPIGAGRLLEDVVRRVAAVLVLWSVGAGCAAPATPRVDPSSPPVPTAPAASEPLAAAPEASSADLAPQGDRPALSGYCTSMVASVLVVSAMKFTVKVELVQ
jgi:hypothetical protein